MDSSIIQLIAMLGGVLVGGANSSVIALMGARNSRRMLADQLQVQVDLARAELAVRQALEDDKRHRELLREGYFALSVWVTDLEQVIDRVWGGVHAGEQAEERQWTEEILAAWAWETLRPAAAGADPFLLERPDTWPR
jgi:hypothetical protein